MTLLQLPPEAESPLPVFLRSIRLAHAVKAAPFNAGFWMLMSKATLAEHGAASDADRFMVQRQTVFEKVAASTNHTELAASKAALGALLRHTAHEAVRGDLCPSVLREVTQTAAIFAVIADPGSPDQHTNSDHSAEEFHAGMLAIGSKRGDTIPEALLVFSHGRTLVESAKRQYDQAQRREAETSAQCAALTRVQTLGDDLCCQWQRTPLSEGLGAQIVAFVQCLTNAENRMKAHVVDLDDTPALHSARAVVQECATGAARFVLHHPQMPIVSSELSTLFAYLSEPNRMFGDRRHDFFVRLIDAGPKLLGFTEQHPAEHAVDLYVSVTDLATTPCMQDLVGPEITAAVAHHMDIMIQSPQAAAVRRVVCADAIAKIDAFKKQVREWFPTGKARTDDLVMYAAVDAQLPAEDVITAARDLHNVRVASQVDVVICVLDLLKKTLTLQVTGP